jgi:anthranilate synthase component 1
MEIIEELENSRRGIYGGAIGYLDFTGNLDTCIAIRTAILKGNKAYVQAGAGVVADSLPESEDAECLNKAAAVIGAISSANKLRKLQ